MLSLISISFSEVFALFDIRFSSKKHFLDTLSYKIEKPKILETKLNLTFNLGCKLEEKQIHFWARFRESLNYLHTKTEGNSGGKKIKDLV